MSFPVGPEQVTEAWLSEALGGTVERFDLEQIGVGVGILGRLYRVTLAGEGVPPSVIAKFPTLDEGARMNVVAPLRFYEKEVRFYEQAAGATPLATPAVHFSAFDAESGDFALLLEDFGSRRMADQTVGCTIDDARTAVDAMAALHAAWWDSPRFDELPWLYAAKDPPFPQVIGGMFKQAWPRFLEGFGSHVPPRIRAFGERFPDLVPWFFEQAARPPITLCHGDFRLDNFFFATDASHAAVAGVDWQIAIKGRGGYDLGYFVSQSLTTAHRRTHEDELLDRYEQALAANGVVYPDGELRHDYRWTIAFCFTYPVVAGGQIELANERAVELVTGMLDRAITAIDDTDALALLPGE